MKSVRIFMK